MWSASLVHHYGGAVCRIIMTAMSGCHVYGLCPTTLSVLSEGSPVTLPALQLQFNSP